MPDSPFPSTSTVPSVEGAENDQVAGKKPAAAADEHAASAAPDYRVDAAPAGESPPAWGAAAGPDWPRANQDWSPPSHVTVNGASPWAEQPNGVDAPSDQFTQGLDAGTRSTAGDPMLAAPSASSVAPEPAPYRGDYAAAHAAGIPVAPPGRAAGGVGGPGRPQRPAPPRGPRRARLQLRHIDPWTVLKFSCVLSVALFFVWLITIGVLYGVLDITGAISKINDTVTTINGTGSNAPITPGIVFGGAAIIGVVNIILFIALSTIGAVVYNLCADLVGGIEVTLAERDA